MTSMKTVASLAFALIAPGLPAAAQQNPQEHTGRMMGQGGMMGPGMMHGPGMGQGGMMGSGMMHCPGMMQGSGMPGPMMGGPQQHIEGRLAFLKTELKITSQQEQVWSAYAEAARVSAKSMQGMHDQMIQMMSSSTNPIAMPERMQWHEQMMSSRLEALKKLRSAAVPLYNALSAEQKQIADNLLWMM
jgi:hypothetical protein